MPIVWARIGAELKRYRVKARLTQDGLAAKVGVRWNTIARLETGKRRPSLEMLEKLAVALNCRIRDLLPEEEATMDTSVQAEREPSLRGAPSYFRAGVVEAGARKVIGRDMNTGSAIRAGYFQPGWHLAIHLDEYLSDDAAEELHKLADIDDNEALRTKLLAFLDQEFPGCMALIPRPRRRSFLDGVLSAIEQGRLAL